MSRRDMELCGFVDDYLDGDLSDQQLRDFLDHTGHCQDCRDQLEAQATFDELVAEARTAFDVWQAETKAGSRVSSTVGKKPMRYWLASCGVVAATLFLAVVVRSTWIRTRPQTEGHRQHPVVEAVPQPGTWRAIGKDIDAMVDVKVSFPEEGEYLAEEIETENPHVTIYWLHPIANSTNTNDTESSTKPDGNNLLARR